MSHKYPKSITKVSQKYYKVSKKYPKSILKVSQQYPIPDPSYHTRALSKIEFSTIEYYKYLGQTDQQIDRPTNRPTERQELKSLYWAGRPASPAIISKTYDEELEENCDTSKFLEIYYFTRSWDAATNWKKLIGNLS